MKNELGQKIEEKHAATVRTVVMTMGGYDGRVGRPRYPGNLLPGVMLAKSDLDAAEKRILVIES